ncbi:hypothetical protein ACRALDRAFT_1068701 [Sodiomyces alcalophilus JCM 7366]|uniref:uncharacterized protein n=1 Tax=Sodiomyces alcalophilus JCM 7366 TaxID=591952 RepID=UPI0039B3A204
MASTFKVSARADESTSHAAVDQMYNMLPALLGEAEHNEMWGIDFTGADAHNRTPPRTIVLQKFIRANKFNVTKAAGQFLTALKWRKEHRPRTSSLGQTFERDKFGGIGYVTRLRSTIRADQFVITWNLYGRIKDLPALFRDAARFRGSSKSSLFGQPLTRTRSYVFSFQEFRIALMELAIDELRIRDAVFSLPAYGIDHYKIIQVHDCAGHKPKWICQEVRHGLRHFAQLFQELYPELLEYHHFVELGLKDSIGMNLGALVAPLLRDSIGYRIGRFRVTRKREEFAEDLFPESEAGHLILRRDLPAEFGGRADLAAISRTVLLSNPPEASAMNDEGQKQENPEQDQEPPQGDDPDDGHPPDNLGAVPKGNQKRSVLRRILRQSQSTMSESGQGLLEAAGEGTGESTGEGAGTGEGAVASSA